MIQAWHIPIEGFTQHLGRACGIETLRWKLRDLPGVDTDFSEVMEPLEWDRDMDRVASYIARRSDAGQTLCNVYAYSWGAGRGFVELAEALRQRGLLVHIAVLADPVYRSEVLPTWLPINLLSLTPLPKITIPANVQCVRWLRQANNKPAGHDLVAASKDRTHIEPPIVVEGVHHSSMDDYPRFHAMAIAAATELVELTGVNAQAGATW